MKTNQSPAENKNSNKTLVIILTTLVLFLGSYSGYLYSRLLTFEEVLLTSKEVEKEAELENILFDIDCNILAYELLSSNYTKLGLENEAIQISLADLEQEIEEWKSRSWTSDAELREARKNLDIKLAAIRLDLATRTREVEKLESANKVLVSSVDSLIAISDENSQNIEVLSEQVEVASVLNAEDLAVSIISNKDKEIIKKTYKEKEIEKIKVHFNIAENKVAKHDLKSLVLQIIEPSGSVLFDINHGGGSFAKADGHNDFYTQRQTINFTNTHQSVDFFYEKGNPMQVGTYQVIVSSDRHKIGATTFTIK